MRAKRIDGEKPVASFDKHDRLSGNADAQVQVRAEGSAHTGRGEGARSAADRGTRRPRTASEEISRSHSARVEASRFVAQQERAGRRILVDPRSLASDGRPGHPDSGWSAGADSLRQPDGLPEM